MREFMVLIGQLLFVVIVQSVIEAVLDTEDRVRQIKVVNIACVVFCYALLVRYVYNNLWAELATFINFTF